MKPRPPGQLKQMQQNQAQTERKKQKSSEAEKGAWREYNKSGVGRKRYRRWRQSAKGKAKLKKRYQARKAWLDEIKAERGCCVCGSKEALALRFEVQPGHKVEFSPELKNLSRSRESWLRVISSCQVLCLNCKAKGKRLRVSRTSEKGVVNDTKNRKDGSLCLNVAPNTCKVCLTKFEPKPSLNKREFCSDRCRLIYWVLRKTSEALRAGLADGVRGLISELAGIR
jgi:hypothetical protein